MPAAIIPCFRYHDAKAAIRFLCDVFGFTEHAVYETGDGLIAHAQLVLGGSMIMLGSVGNEGEYGELVRTPRQAHGVNTQSVYVIVPQIDAHYARTKAAGCDILLPIRNEDYGGRGYTCRDPEGYIWNFGSYDPWQAPE